MGWEQQDERERVDSIVLRCEKVSDALQMSVECLEAVEGTATDCPAVAGMDKTESRLGVLENRLTQIEARVRRMHQLSSRIQSRIG